MINESVICIDRPAFYALLDEVVKRIDDKFGLSEKSLWVGNDEAMDILQIKSKTTLLNLRSTGQIRYSQPQHKIILYERQSLLDYIEKHAQNTF